VGEITINIRPGAALTGAFLTGGQLPKSAGIVQRRGVWTKVARVRKNAAPAACPPPQIRRNVDGRG